MNVRFHLFLPYCLFVLTTQVVAHELEDGFVERAVEVVVREQKLQLNYFIGLNENTMNQWLDQWDSQPALDGDLQAVTDSESFAKELPGQLGKAIGLRVDDAEQELSVVGIEICPKHHFDFVVKFEYDLPSDQTVEIELSDCKLNQWKSAARYSLKGVGGTIVSNTNVAPIIVRSKRIEFDKVNEDERAKKSKIVATVITPPSDSKNDSATE